MSELDTTPLPSRTYRVSNGRIVMIADGAEAMNQAIDKVLRTPRFEVPWLSQQYGTDVFQLIGQPIDYAKSEVERMITESLSVDDRIIDISVNSIEQTSNTDLLVKLTITTIFGEFKKETEVSK
ncbi:hypothetical protein JC2156_04220 [Weissella koreensis KCTC 3621]|uniref:DUF2634 domain-containing protein n=1 Tax=Weissella koreensis TaxID=165096 RepID=UPI00026F3643|nr:DUF2634 domain-containing protein [Weissella koreensis]EJF33712.1 hypothetical protein JC2156_05260 [Weissella koreensis KCTC 3621]EJF34114.1 hypothetical protein JC2156_04220 [Weissella koreensis KCTC 3621]